ncbi:MAG: HipA N-terminal domain-containing protein [Opitutaceae bacterium]
MITEIQMWGRSIGAITWDADSETASFQYEPAFLTSGIEVAHQMTVNGKRDHFTLEDLRECAKRALLKRGRAKDILQEVIEAVQSWTEFAERADVNPNWIGSIQKTHRIDW